MEGSTIIDKVDTLQNGSYNGVDLSTSTTNEIHLSEDTTEASSNEKNVVCSSLNANVDYWLCNNLAKPVAEYGKAAVMKLSTFQQSEPKFNKYPGAIEWKNAIYLWVNIGGSTGYTNSFSEKGRYMMWYGGSKMHAGMYS